MAGELVGTNLATYGLSAAAVTARNAQYPGTPFTDTGTGTFADPYLGCNRAGSNACGIGIATGNKEPSLNDWTTADQEGTARIPQLTQHIGGSGLGAGNQSTNDVRAISIGDVDDTLNLGVANAQAAPDAEFDTVNNIVNKTDQTIEIGERSWGVVV